MDAAREIFSRTPNGWGTADRDVLRAERGAVVADKTVPAMMGEMACAAAYGERPTTTGTNPVQGGGRRDLRERSAATSPPTPVAEDGHRRHRVQVSVRQYLPRAGLRLRQRGNRRLVDIRVAEHGAAGRDARHAHPPCARRRASGDAVRHGLAIPERRYVERLRARASCRACRARETAWTTPAPRGCSDTLRRMNSSGVATGTTSSRSWI